MKNKDKTMQTVRCPKCRDILGEVKNISKAQKVRFYCRRCGMWINTEKNFK